MRGKQPEQDEEYSHNKHGVCRAKSRREVQTQTEPEEEYVLTTATLAGIPLLRRVTIRRGVQPEKGEEYTEQDEEYRQPK